MLGAVNVSPRPVNSSISSACCTSSRQSMITFYSGAGGASSAFADGSVRYRGGRGRSATSTAVISMRSQQTLYAITRRLPKDVALGYP